MLLDLYGVCDVNTTSCFIYASQPECSFDRTVDLMKNVNCSESTWMIHDTEEIYVKLVTPWEHPERPQKSLSFEYKFLSCKKGTSNRFETYFL